jgi:hypothetical protein
MKVPEGYSAKVNIGVMSLKGNMLTTNMEVSAQFLIGRIMFGVMWQTFGVSGIINNKGIASPQLDLDSQEMIIVGTDRIKFVDEWYVNAAQIAPGSGSVRPAGGRESAAALGAAFTTSIGAAAIDIPREFWMSSGEEISFRAMCDQGSSLDFGVACRGTMELFPE